jgi:hypothetical protein
MTTSLSRIAWRAAGRCHLPQPVRAPQRRPFFASSTDHTRLLADAQVHRLPTDPTNSNLQHQYVLVAAGMDLVMVQKVPQLHLARLLSFSANGDDGIIMMGGAKVVTRTLGAPAQVCGPLVEAARKDGIVHAKSTLHGLSDYVRALPEGPVAGVPDQHWDAVQAMAHGKDFSHDDELGAAWEILARDFIASGLCLEANLYVAQGGRLTEILPHEDSSEFADTCAGAMAVFRFD